jgi:hypothetical protein
MRTRLYILIAANLAAGALMLFGAAAPAQASCGYNPCGNRAQYGYGYGYSYQYAQPSYQPQYYQQPYQQQYYQQPAYYPQPAYQQPAYYPQPYAQPCCRSHFGVGFGARSNCCAQQAYAQPVYAPPVYPQPMYAQPTYAQTYATVAPRDDWASYWASSPAWAGSNYSPIRLEYEGALVPQTEQNMEQNYAYANPAPFPETAETYVQPVPRWYRKHVYRARPQTRVIYRNVYRTRVIHAKPRPHVLVPGNPSTSASTYEVAPRKVLRP